jgi:hypothetical protein
MTLERRSLLERAEAAKLSKNFLEAEILYRQLAAHLGYSLGPNHFEVAIVLHQLATLLEEMGRAEDAGPFRKQASTILQKLNRGGGEQP